MILAAVSLATVGVLAVPAMTGVDGFPVSSHPMYASARSAEASFVTAVGLATDGSPVSLNITTIADTDDPLVARRRLERGAGPDRLDQTCAEIADRAGGVHPDLVAVEVVEVRHDVVAYAAGRTAPLGRVVLTTCPVVSGP